MNEKEKANKYYEKAKNLMTLINTLKEKNAPEYVINTYKAEMKMALEIAEMIEKGKEVPDIRKVIVKYRKIQNKIYAKKEAVKSIREAERKAA